MYGLGINTQGHLQSDQTWPIRLFEIGGDPVLRYTDSDVPVVWNGYQWQPRGISYSAVKLSRDFRTDTYRVSIDNIDDSLIAWYFAYDPTGYETTVYKGFTDGTLSAEQLSLLDNQAKILFRGTNVSFKADIEFEISVKSGMDAYSQRGPKTMQHRLCRWAGVDGFKGVNCGYGGAATVCNYTWDRCRQLGNQARFGGFKDLSPRDDE